MYVYVPFCHPSIRGCGAFGKQGCTESVGMSRDGSAVR